MTKTHMLFIALTTFALTSTASAQTDDSLRCEARKMRAESQYFGCLSRCDRRVDRWAARPADRRTAASAPDCDAVCTQHYDDDLARIGGKAPCTLDPGAGPDPKDCEARMLRLSASTLRCQARCGRRHAREGFEPNDCLAVCQTRCDTAADELKADPVCAAGRISEQEACTLH